MVLTCMSIVLGSMAISIKQLALFVVVVMAASAVAVTPDASEAASTEDGFEFLAAGDSAFITNYTGNEAIVKIPSTVSDGTNTYNVVGIDDSAFYGKSMVEVIVPETVQSIGNSAFGSCPNLMFVSILGEPTFGTNVFMLSPELTLIELSKNITVENNIFEHGASKISVNAPSGVMFECPGLEISYIDDSKSVVKFISVNGPENLDVNGFFIVDPGSTLQIPAGAEVVGYDTLLTVEGQEINSEYKVTQDSTTVAISYSLHEYDIVFKNGDIVVQESKVKHGETITAPATNPTKEQDEKNTYIFAGWEGFTEGMTATQDVTFNAKFTETPRTYTVSFVSEGVPVQTQTLAYGSVITAPAEDPVKESEQGVDYRFVGWDGFTEGMTVTGDATFTAKFDSMDHVYTIQFVSDDEVVSTLQLGYGDTITAPAEDPVKESADGVDYVFAGWDGFTEDMTVTGDMTFEAVFNEVPQDDGGDSTWIYVAVIIVVVLVVLALVVLRKHL